MIKDNSHSKGTLCIAFPLPRPRCVQNFLAEWVDCKSVDPSKLYRTTCKILEGLEGIYICSVCQFRRVLAIWQFEEMQPIIIKNVQYISYAGIVDR